jgi:hypothetical protein
MIRDRGRFPGNDIPRIGVPMSIYILCRLPTQTRLGRAVGVVINELGIAGKMITLIDGGIERIEFCAPKRCLYYLVCEFLLPWDRLPNVVYMWPALGKLPGPMRRQLDHVAASR